MSNQTHYLVTGGAGFVGSHLCEALLERGGRVTVIDDLSTGSFENIRHLAERHSGDQRRFRFAIDSITNESVLDRLVSECDVIVHLAAAVGVRLIVENPIHTIETNIMGTESVLRTALRYKVKVLLASTSEVYGKGDSMPFREDSDIVLGPVTRNRWAYAASKLIDEFLTLAYFQEQKLPVVIFRLFNTVGPRQTGRYGMVIPRFVRQALEGRPLTVYGDGAQSRCFLHVRDAVEAILLLADDPRACGEVFNIGSEEEITILDLARRVIRFAKANTKKAGGEVVHISYDDAYQVGFEDMRRRVPDVGKISRLTEWRRQLGLEQVLEDIFRFEAQR